MCVGALALASGCMPHGRRHELPDFARAGGVPTTGATAEQDLAADEASLATTVRLDVIVRLALARNADILEEEARVRERLERIPPSSRLPDLELKYEQWGVPLVRPYALGDADTLMLGVRQTFPAHGSLAARERAAESEAEVALFAFRARQLDVVRQVVRTYAALFLADREYQLHLEHVQLTERIGELLRSNFRTGSAAEQDVLRVAVELKGLHRELARIEQRKRSASALLNATIARDGNAPLGALADLQPTELKLELAALEAMVQTGRAEVIAAGHRVERAQADVDLATSNATWPSIMAGVDYWFMPTLDERHGYGAMISINLPWLNAKRREDVKVAERGVTADRRALEAIRIAVRYEVDDAFARYSAARTTYLLTRDELVPVALQSFQAAQAGFAAGRGNALGLVDALRSLLSLRLEEVRELVDLRVAIADLERAIGVDLEETAIAPSQGTPP
jgi:outer membrane protein TolC